MSALLQCSSKWHQNAVVSDFRSSLTSGAASTQRTATRYASTSRVDLNPHRRSLQCLVSLCHFSVVLIIRSPLSPSLIYFHLHSACGSILKQIRKLYLTNLTFRPRIRSLSHRERQTDRQTEGVGRESTKCKVYFQALYFEPVVLDFGTILKHNHPKHNYWHNPKA